MKRLLIPVFALFCIGLLRTALPAFAYADVSSDFEGCHSFQASGSSSAPYAMIYAFNEDTDEQLGIAVVPVNDGHYTASLSFAQQPAGAKIEYEVWGAPTTDTADFSWDGEDYFLQTIKCKTESGDNAPQIPTGFAQRSITCDTPVYNTPAGSPVGEAHVTAGQTWYVDPTPVQGSDGKQWTEIFAGGYSDGFIPTACVS